MSSYEERIGRYAKRSGTGDVVTAIAAEADAEIAALTAERDALKKQQTALLLAMTDAYMLLTRLGPVPDHQYHIICNLSAAIAIAKEST